MAAVRRSFWLSRVARATGARPGPGTVGARGTRGARGARGARGWGCRVWHSEASCRHRAQPSGPLPSHARTEVLINSPVLRDGKLVEQMPPSAASSTWLGLLLPASLNVTLAPCLAPGSLAESPHRWIFEDFVHVGSVGIGLPGIVSLGIFLNPMFEAMRRIREARDVGQMPMLPYSAMASQGVVWTAYGMLLNNPAIWTPNLCAAGLGMYYMLVYSSYWQNPGHLLVSHIFKVASTLAFSALACGLPHDWAMNLLGITGNMMTLFMFGGPLAAIRTVVRERNTRALNLGFTCIVYLNCTLWFFYAYFMLDDPYIYLQDGLGVFLATIQLGLFARYGVQRHWSRIRQ